MCVLGGLFKKNEDIVIFLLIEDIVIYLEGVYPVVGMYMCSLGWLECQGERNLKYKFQFLDSSKYIKLQIHNMLYLLIAVTCFLSVTGCLF